MPKEDIDDTEDFEFGPIHNPVRRFYHLPPETREWLEELREEDIKLLVKAVRFYNRAEAVAGFFKWFWIVMIGAFLGGVSLWEGILKVLAWIKLGTPK